MSLLLQRVAEQRSKAPAARRAILDRILEDPDRVLEESFELLAERAGSSVPTVMRTCRDLGFAGLREFKLALAHELALGGSPLHRRVNIADRADEVVAKIARSAAASVAGLRTQLDMEALDAAVGAIASARHVDLFGAGATSWFMAQDLQARLFRLGLSANAWADYHLQQVAAGAQSSQGVVIAISHVGGMPSLLDAVDIARQQGARAVVMTRPGTPLAARADMLLGVSVPDDAVMHVGIDAYLTHLTVIEILTVLVAQHRGDPAVQRLQAVRGALKRHGIDIQTHPLQSWDGGGVGARTMRPVLLEAGLVVDGSGGPAYTGDVLLAGERIAAVGAGLRGRLPDGLVIEDIDVVDCRGQVIAPGFIDAHTHDDAIVLHDPACLPKLSQGITTVVTGNCGISLAPYATPAARPPLSLLGIASFHYPSMRAYGDAVSAAQPALNVVALIGHTTLRFAAMRDLDRAASADERAKMAALLEACMAEGAAGLSSGLFYEEAFAAPADEVTDLARIVARHGGVYTTHLRSEMASIIEAMHEAGDSAFAAGVPLILSHHKCAGPANWGRTRETLPLIDALAERQDIALDVYPYVAGSTVLREDLVDGVIDVMLTWSEPHPEQGGRLLAEVAAEWGVDQKTACRRLQPGGACYFQMDEADVERVIAHPRAMIGSDGLPHDRHPHPRLWGAFPRVFARYWRERRLFTLEQAVHKMTGLTARQFRIAGRGLLRPGMAADVVLFDPQRIADRATFAEPLQRSVGVVAVYVNGVPAFAEGMGGTVLARPGRMLAVKSCAG